MVIGQMVFFGEARGGIVGVPELFAGWVQGSSSPVRRKLFSNPPHPQFDDHESEKNTLRKNQKNLTNFPGIKNKKYQISRATGSNRSEQA